MFEGLGAYANAAKVATYLLLAGLLTSIANGLIEHGRMLQALDAAAITAQRDVEVGRKLNALRNKPVSVQPTITNTIEVIRDVETIIEKQVFVCDDVTAYAIVRNDTRNCIFRSPDSERNCITE